MRQRLASFILRYRLYRVLPARWCAALICGRVRPEDIEWAREQLKDWPERIA